MGITSIEWTQRTWNPLTGCTKVSPGCDNCYAKTLHERFNGPDSFETVQLHPERLRQPISWRKPAKVFVNSMSDLFHKDVPDDYIAQVFAVMACAPQHTFQVLTKRHARMRSLLVRLASEDFLGESFADEVRRLLPQPFTYDSRMADPAYADVHHGKRKAGVDPYIRVRFDWPLPNVHLGVSVEDQHWADIRIPALLATPAAVHWISAEPLLGPVDLDRDGWLQTLDGHEWRGGGLDWVVVGGESGPGARPMHPQWVRSIQAQCDMTNVPFLFKQWGNWVAPEQATEDAWQRWESAHAGEDQTKPIRLTKKSAGRELDGRTWDEYPGGGR